jgi:ATP-dependent DNA helicase RecG
MAVQAALSLPAEARGRELLALPEGQWFERKSVRISPQGLAKTLVAFANAEGGTVVVGPSGNAVEGTTGAAKHVNSLRQAALDLTTPPVPVDCRSVDCVTDAGVADHLLVFDVTVGQVVHATTADEVLLRVGDENRKLSFSQRQELFYDKGQAQFEAGIAPHVVMDDLDSNATHEYAAALGVDDVERVMAARGLLTRRRELTIAAYLLFGQVPQDMFPAAHLRVLSYRGLSAQTGRDQNLVEDRRFEGSIPNVIRAAASMVRELQPMRRALGGDGLFVVEGVIPEDAWLEGIVNAVIHRSYSIGGDHIRVTVFHDRIEIESPGRFPGLVRPSDLRSGVRFARNPRIARACADLRFGQELGEGIRRMFGEMQARGLTEPLYKETSASVRLTLSALARHPDLSREALEILDVLRKGMHVSTGDVQQAIRLSRPAVLRHLYALRNAGLIEWVGKSPQDPRAFWLVR